MSHDHDSENDDSLLGVQVGDLPMSDKERLKETVRKTPILVIGLLLGGAVFGVIFWLIGRL